MAFNEARFINKGKQEQPSVDEDVVKGNPIVEAVFKPRWNLPLLSKYTSFVGRQAKKADKYVEKKVGTSKAISLGALLGDYSLYGKMISPGEIISTVTPFIGDVETGKYSLFDLALGGLETIPLAKGAKTSISSVGKRLAKPTERKFQKKIQKALKKGGKENLESALKWQKEWITDPETFVRQKQGGRIADAPGSYYTTAPPEEIKKIEEIWNMKPRSKKEVERFVKLAKKPNMSRSKMKKEGFVHEWDSYLKYKDEMIEEFDRLEFHERLPWQVEKVGGAEEWVRLQDETMEQWRKRSDFARQPWALKPGEVDPRKTTTDKVKWGFGLPDAEYAGVWRPSYDVTDINQAMKRGVRPDRMGRYHEMVEIDPAMSQKDIKSLAVHELQHYITKGNTNIPHAVGELIQNLNRGDLDDLVGYWKKNKLSVFEGGDAGGKWKSIKGAKESEIKGTIRYFRDTTEVQARLQEIRLSLGVSPGEKITKEMLILKGVRTKSPYTNLKKILGEDNIIKALNTLPAVVPMTTETSLFNQWDREDNIF